CEKVSNKWSDEYMNPMNTREIYDGVVFNSIFDKRFKTMKLTVNIFQPLNAETAAVNALLCYMLVRCCKKYPDFTTLSKKLGSLYGAELNGSVSKMGDMQCLNIAVSGLDDRYALDGESISGQLGELLCEVLFNPKAENGRFDEDDMLQEKRQLLDMIDSEFNDKRTYASQRLIEIMCSDELYGVSRCGTKEQINDLTTADVYDAWQNMLCNAHFEFTYVGDSNPEKVIDIIDNSFKEIKRTPIELSNDVIYTVPEQNESIEEMEVAQSKLEIGFRTACAEPEQEATATRLMCAVLGGTATSKLFTNVREKKSLCYYCMSRFYRLKGIMVVESGVETANIEAAKAAILNEIEEMKKGNISDFEIDSAKLAIVNSFRSIVDTVTGISSWYSTQLMDASVDTPEQAAEKINAVTKDEIVKAANKLLLDTVYVLKSK
ncbi:MAG: insulinase family protein, partial [Ruminococcus sp.]|nr:insulinase family protein [Ruminococcus sp.]